MSTLLLFLLTAGACTLFILSQRPWPRPGTTRSKLGLLSWSGKSGQRTKKWRLPFRGRGAPEIAMPRLVRQLAALLASGRAGPRLWGALAEVLATEYGFDGEGSQLGGGRVTTGESSTVLEKDTEQNPTIELILAVQRASLLGLPSATALKSVYGHRNGSARSLTRGGGRNGLSTAQLKIWSEVAACFEICEGSGAPVAEVLSRLATSLDAEDDAAAMRETALAGPQATVRLLTWLPFIGLGLGVLMGVDPLRVLLGSPVGWVCLGVGIFLVLFGRHWSNRLIKSAARPQIRHVPRGQEKARPAGYSARTGTP